MKKQSKTKLISLIVLSLLLSSCAPKPPDIPVCENLVKHLGIDPDTKDLVLLPSPTCKKQINESECGHCTYIVSGKEIYVGEKEGHWLNGKPWGQIKEESIYLPAEESFAPLADYIINSCKKLKCNSQIEEFKVKLNSLKVQQKPSMDVDLN